MARIFISHSSSDNAAALALASWLEANGWRDYFLDIDGDRGIAPGERWMAALTGAVDRCEAVIFLVSPAWRDSKFCFAEFFEAKKLGKRIFGVIVEPIPLSQLPEQMTAEWQLCDLTDERDPVSFTVARLPAVPQALVRFPRAGLEALSRGLQKAGLDASTFVWPPEGQPDRSPYPGLRAMEEIDAAVFFGREASIVRAIDQMRLVRERDVEQLFVVLGASGAGKSSFLRAGLLPRLRRDSEHFVVLPPIRPERAAISGSQGLLNSLHVALALAGQATSPAQIRAELASGGLIAVLGRIGSMTESANRSLGLDGPTYIVPVDQAEELFASDGQDEARQFLEHVDTLHRHMSAGGTTAARARPIRVLLVLTIRSDSLPSLQSQPVLQGLSPVLFSLPAMPVSEFKAVIEGPAQRHSATVKPLVIAPQLTEQLVVDAQGADALPLLALTLEWLYREFTGPEGTRVGYDEYQRLGGVRGVIGMAVERAFERPGSEPAIPAQRQEQERLLQQMFPYLATVDPDTGEWKRRVALREGMRTKLPQADAMVSRLVDQRLLLADLRSTTDGEPVEVVEVAHEALLRQWDAMERWLREFAAALSASESIRKAANDWRRSKGDEALLVHTAHRLQAAEALMADERLAARFESVDGEYLAACGARDRRVLEVREDQLRRIAEQQAARAVLQRRVKWGLLAVSLFVFALAGWIVRQTRAVTLQTSVALTAAAQSAAAQKRFDQSLRLGVLATRGSWLGPHASDVYSVAFGAGRASTLQTLIVVESKGAGVESASLSPDGTRVLTVSLHSSARLWDADTGKPVGEPMAHSGLVAASFSPDGTRVLTASLVFTDRLWDAVTGKPVGKPMQGGSKASFSGDGERVLTASTYTGKFRIWDGHTGEPLSEPLGDGLAFAELSPNRKRVVTASQSNDDDATIWDVDTGRPVGVPMKHGNWVTSAKFSPDGRRVVTASRDNTARLWDAETGKPVSEPMTIAQALDTAGPLRLDLRVLSASFSPDGKRILTFGADGTARVWDAETAKPVGKLLTHGGIIVSASFSPDSEGKFVLTASEDQTARIWNAQSGEPVGEPMMHDRALTSASFSSDGQRVVTSSTDGMVRVWDAGGDKPVVLPPKPGQESVSSDFTRSRSAIVSAADRNVGFWIRVRRWFVGDLWVQDLCRTKLRGSIGAITDSDVRTARILSRDRIGENVCDGV